MTLASFIARSKSEKENWRYTDLESLLSSVTPADRESSRTPPTAVIPAKAGIQRRASARHETPASTASETRLVFLNGIFQPKQSRFGSTPSCILMGDLTSGYALTIGEQTCLATLPIELVFEADENAPSEIPLKLSVDIGKNGRLTLLENYRPSPVPTTLVSTITLHERAKLIHGKIVSGGPHLALHQVRAETGCYYSNFSLIHGSTPVRHELDVMLEGEEAQASLNGIMLLHDREHADTTTRITHKAPRCTSRQVYRTVLDDAAHGVFQGKIVVPQGAQKTDGYQLSRALLLSDKAEMDAKPELEINADDVKCSHGSTIGDLDDTAMFYLRSRGLNEKEARALLIEGFVSEMLNEIPVEEWREIFHRELEAWHDL